MSAKLYTCIWLLNCMTKTIIRLRIVIFGMHITVQCIYYTHICLLQHVLLNQEICYECYM
jgi:hypothetical protein